MNEGIDPKQAALQEAGASLGLPLDSEAVGRLLAYLDLLQRWNRTYNLTAVRDPAEMLTQHLVDCLAVVQPLRRQAGQGGRLLDVGSGGGLPGVVIALLCPEWQVTCVDTVGKKAAFVRQVAVEVGVRNLQAEHARVETLRSAPFDVITCRAFSSLPDFVSLTRSLLAPDGTWMAMKGKHPQEELDALPPNVDVFHVEQLTIPGLDADRCLVWMKPKKDVP
jgi:16S rRNA (guanine527-N7)-methyltransferase